MPQREDYSRSRYEGDRRRDAGHGRAGISHARSAGNGHGSSHSRSADRVPRVSEGASRVQAARDQASRQQTTPTRRYRDEATGMFEPVGKHAAGRSRSGMDVEITYSRRLANGDAIARRDRDSYTRQTYTRAEEEATASRSMFRVLLLVLASVIYWPIAIVGVTAPFSEGFNPGTLSMGQVVFSRVWLAFVLLGAFYLAITNIGHFRDCPIFRARGKGSKLVRIIVFLLADIAISFVVIRLVCLF
ncbi:MAG: hypothetical protein ACOYIP_01810 [Coriobacteriales bacterium]|jgi:hypothetical protein